VESPLLTGTQPVLRVGMHGVMTGTTVNAITRPIAGKDVVRRAERANSVLTWTGPNVVDGPTADHAVVTAAAREALNNSSVVLRPWKIAS
jgi:hypothetical protein